MSQMDEVFSVIRAARMVVMVHDDHEDAEGDLVMAAEKVTPEHVNFMATHGRGIVSVALPERRIRELGIPLVVANQAEPRAEQAGAVGDGPGGGATGSFAIGRPRSLQG